MRKVIVWVLNTLLIPVSFVMSAAGMIGLGFTTTIAHVATMEEAANGDEDGDGNEG